MAVTEGRESASRGRGGPSLPTWCKSRSGPAWSAARPRHHDRSLHALARPRRPAAQGAPHSEARPPRPSPSPRASPSRRQRGGGASGAAARKPLAHDPDFLAAGILFALMISVLAGVLAAMLVADSERAADLPGNKSVGSGALREAVLRARRSADVGLDEDAVGEDVLAEGFTGLAGLAAPREDEDDDDAVPDYLLDLLQSHRNQERLGEDFILGYHDDYRERYDGFDQPPPFRRRRHKRASTEPAAAEAAARRTLRASDLEISEEEAFSTRVFVTTPRRQR